MESYGEYKIEKRITKRDYSELFHVTRDGTDYCLKIVRPNKFLPATMIKESYNIYDKLANRTGLVEVYEHGESQDGYYCVMEYLTPRAWHRVEFNDFQEYIPAINQIESSLYIQGVMMCDFVPINFMTDGLSFKMIDLDTLIEIPDMFYPLDMFKKDHNINKLAWYGYAIARSKQWLMKQYT